MFQQFYVPSGDNHKKSRRENFENSTCTRDLSIKNDCFSSSSTFNNSMTLAFNIKTCPSFVEYAAKLLPNEHSAEICSGVRYQVFLVREKNHKNIIFLCCVPLLKFSLFYTFCSIRVFCFDST